VVIVNHCRAGHSTLLDELKVQLPRKPSTIVLSVGGGGLLLGVLKGLERLGECVNFSSSHFLLFQDIVSSIIHTYPELM
jgi:threonine dehydratase